MNREQAREALCALSLGELDEDRAKAVLGWVEQDAELAEELLELGEVLELSTRALQSGPDPRLSSWRRLRIRVAAFKPFGFAKSAFVLPVVVLASLLLLVRGPEPLAPSAPGEQPASAATAAVQLLTADDADEAKAADAVAPIGDRPARPRANDSWSPGPGKPTLGRRGTVPALPPETARETPRAGVPAPPPAAALAPRRYSRPSPVRNSLRRPVAPYDAPTRGIVRPSIVNYDHFLDVDDHPLSTFSTDVDTASYSRLRQSVRDGVWPGEETRIEELINYFPYDEFEPTTGPIAIRSELTRAPWSEERWLVRVALRAAGSSAMRPASNLVFLVDVSGSMKEPDKLPLLVDALSVLVRRLNASDRVSIVAYAGYSGVLLEPTPGNRKDVILHALRSLSAEGSTNGAGGILEAYQLARGSWIDGGVNRVILATDGDFNVGIDDPGELERLIAEQAEMGVYLSALGFGRSRDGDLRLEALADRGNGNYSFIDTLAEAEKVFGEELESTTTVAAHDVKVQVEFDRDVVRRYRLIGYDDRRLADEDFADDRVDAGDLGTGHSVTAIYEIEPRSDAESASPLRIDVRYKPSRTSASELLSHEVARRPIAFSQATRDTRFAVAVTAFGGFVRGYTTLGSLNLSDVERWAAGASGGPGAKYRREFVDLVARMRRLTTPSNQAVTPEAQRFEPDRDGCDPPYYVDPVTGIRKLKPHCMR